MICNNLSYVAKTATSLSEFKSKLASLPLLDHSDSVICMCEYFKLLLIILQNCHLHCKA